ncbi:hypothetical protein MMC06_003149 [Schaereria dolodes]|nr:hypothetical protein [Schaereria dolodes]
MASTSDDTNSKKFEPKNLIKLNPPKDDPISQAELAEYNVFAGKDASRALAQSSLKAEDCSPDYEDLEEKDKVVLDQWFTFFSKRYNIVGKVVD